MALKRLCEGSSSSRSKMSSLRLYVSLRPSSIADYFQSLSGSDGTLQLCGRTKRSTNGTLYSANTKSSIVNIPLVTSTSNKDDTEEQDWYLVILEIVYILTATPTKTSPS
jgi:hypothetical protein